MDVLNVGPIIGAVLTAMVLSYLLLGDRFAFYRIGVHILIGALVGYTLGVVMRMIFVEIILDGLVTHGHYILLIPLLIGFWLILFKSTTRLAYAGNLAVAYLIGVGTAVALSGALVGTLIPQIGATAQAVRTDLFSVEGMVDLFNGLMIVVGTVCTLLAFKLTIPRRGELAGKQSRLVQILGSVGQVFLVVALGVGYAGALTTALSILIGRIQAILSVFAAW